MIGKFPEVLNSTGSSVSRCWFSQFIVSDSVLVFWRNQIAWSIHGYIYIVLFDVWDSESTFQAKYRLSSWTNLKEALKCGFKYKRENGKLHILAVGWSKGAKCPDLISFPLCFPFLLGMPLDPKVGVPNSVTYLI